MFFSRAVEILIEIPQVREKKKEKRNIENKIVIVVLVQVY